MERLAGEHRRALLEDGVSQFETLRCERDGAVATVTLDRPKALNAINGLMMQELGEAFRELAVDDVIRVILLTGAGERAFAAGADIRELVELDEVAGRSFSEAGQRVFSALESCGKPVIACLNGLALGGGLELALACTLRIASEGARFGLPEARLGLVPGFGGYFRLQQLVGRSAALRLVLTAATVGADEALRAGLVDEMVPPVELMPRGRAMAEEIAGLAPLAIRALLELDQRETGLSAEAALAVEAEVFGRLCGTVDKREGVEAFLGKRTASWQGV